MNILIKLPIHHLHPTTQRRSTCAERCVNPCSVSSNAAKWKSSGNTMISDSTRYCCANTSSQLMISFSSAGRIRYKRRNRGNVRSCSSRRRCRRVGRDRRSWSPRGRRALCGTLRACLCRAPRRPACESRADSFRQSCE